MYRLPMGYLPDPSLILQAKGSEAVGKALKQDAQQMRRPDLPLHYNTVRMKWEEMF